jgi:hypothetical protein
MLTLYTGTIYAAPRSYLNYDLSCFECDCCTCDFVPDNTNASHEAGHKDATKGTKTGYIKRRMET